MPSVILDYKASVPDSFSGIPPHPVIPQVPTQLQVADLGIFMPPEFPPSAVNRVFLSADVGLNTGGVTFNNAVVFRIYRDGREIFNTTAGLQQPATDPIYNVSFSTVDENVTTGFHVYLLTVQAFISLNAPVGPNAAVFGPITFSGLAVGTF